MAIDIPEEDRQYINEGFAQRLESNSPEFVNVIIEVDPERLSAVLEEAGTLPNVTVNENRIAQGKYIPATVPVQVVPRIARIDGVVLVHQDQISGIAGLMPSLPEVNIPNPANNPLRVWAEERVFNLMTTEDDFTGSIGIQPVDGHRFNLPPTPMGDPLQALLAGIDNYTSADVYDSEFINTLDTVTWMLDTGLTRDHAGGDTQVAVLDTGHSPNPFSTGNRTAERASFVPGEPALDGNGHGSWCTNTVVGKSHPSPWGTCRGVAEEAIHAHYKCLNTFPGFGRTSWILFALDRALDWGADVINLSLGAPQQGPIEEDPYARFIRENCKENAGEREGAIFVVAAGNCLVGDTTVMTTDGPRRIDEVEPGDEVYSFTGGFEWGDVRAEYDDSVGTHTVDEVYENGEQDVYEVTTRTRSIKATDNHPFLVLERGEYGERWEDYETVMSVADEDGVGAAAVDDEIEATREVAKSWLYNDVAPSQMPALKWKQLSEIDEGDLVLASKELPSPETGVSEGANDSGVPLSDLGVSVPDVGSVEEEGVITEGRARVLGAFLGDGWVRHRKRNRGEVGFALPEEPERSMYAQLLRDEYGVDPSTADEKQIVVHDVEFADLFEAYGFGHGAREKELPDWLFRMPSDIQQSFIEGYGDADGHRRVGDDGTTRVVFESPNISLVEAVRDLCIAAGLRATNLRERERHTEFDTQSGHYEYDQKTAVFSVTNMNPEERDYHGWGCRESPSCVLESRDSVPEYTMLERIESIEYVGEETVYDISVPGPRNFWADGLFVHNSGPEKWTIGSPGVADKAITVASWSMLDGAPAAFSSRGPQGEWYKENPDRYGSDAGEYDAREFVKPDVAAPGGGRKTEAKYREHAELLWQASVGWMEGMQDGIRDGTAGMAGTSMASPHVAGFVTRLYDADIIKTASEFKRVMEQNGFVPEFKKAGDHANETEGGKNISVGYGAARESVFSPQ